MLDEILACIVADEAVEELSNHENVVWLRQIQITALHSLSSAVVENGREVRAELWVPDDVLPVVSRRPPVDVADLQP